MSDGQDNFMDPTEEAEWLSRNRTTITPDGRVERYVDGRLVSSAPQSSGDGTFEAEFQAAVEELRGEEREKRVKHLDDNKLSTWASKKAKE